MLQIGDPRVDELVTRPAAARNRSKTEVVLEALERARAGGSDAGRASAASAGLCRDDPKTGLKAEKAFFDDLGG